MQPGEQVQQLALLGRDVDRRQAGRLAGLHRRVDAPDRRWTTQVGEVAVNGGPGLVRHRLLRSFRAVGHKVPRMLRQPSDVHNPSIVVRGTLQSRRVHMHEHRDHHAGSRRWWRSGCRCWLGPGPTTWGSRIGLATQLPASTAGGVPYVDGGSTDAVLRCLGCWFCAVLESFGAGLSVQTETEPWEPSRTASKTSTLEHLWEP